MNIKKLPLILLSLGTLLAVPLALSACSSIDEDDELEEEGSFYSEPPAIPPEARPSIPDPTVEIWRPGYWAPTDEGKFDWIPGEVISRPSSTAVWAPARWVRHAYGWTFEQGHWQ